MQVSFQEGLNCQQESFVTNYEFSKAEEEENSIFDCGHSVKITLRCSCHRIRPA